MDSDVDLDPLVGGWLTLAELGATIEVPVSTLKQWIREGKLVAVPHGERRISSVPADIVHDGVIVRGLASALTVLADVGFGPLASMAWLLTPDELLEGRPIDLMAEGRDVAVRRRAMLLAI